MPRGPGPIDWKNMEFNPGRYDWAEDDESGYDDFMGGGGMAKHAETHDEFYARVAQGLGLDVEQATGVLSEKMGPTGWQGAAKYDLWSTLQTHVRETQFGGGDIGVSGTSMWQFQHAAPQRQQMMKARVPIPKSGEVIPGYMQYGKWQYPAESLGLGVTAGGDISVGLQPGKESKAVKYSRQVSGVQEHQGYMSGRGVPDLGYSRASMADENEKMQTSRIFVSFSQDLPEGAGAYDPGHWGHLEKPVLARIRIPESVPVTDIIQVGTKFSGQERVKFFPGHTGETYSQYKEMEVLAAGVVPMIGAEAEDKGYQMLLVQLKGHMAEGGPLALKWGGFKGGASAMPVAAMFGEVADPVGGILRGAEYPQHFAAQPPKPITGWLQARDLEQTAALHTRQMTPEQQMAIYGREVERWDPDLAKVWEEKILKPGMQETWLQPRAFNLQDPRTQERIKTGALRETERIDEFTIMAEQRVIGIALEVGVQQSAVWEHQKGRIPFELMGDISRTHPEMAKYYSAVSQERLTTLSNIGGAAMFNVGKSAGYETQPIEDQPWASLMVQAAERLKGQGVDDPYKALPGQLGGALMMEMGKKMGKGPGLMFQRPRGGQVAMPNPAAVEAYLSGTAVEGQRFKLPLAYTKLLETYQKKEEGRATEKEYGAALTRAEEELTEVTSSAGFIDRLLGWDVGRRALTGGRVSPTEGLPMHRFTAGREWLGQHMQFAPDVSGRERERAVSDVMEGKEDLSVMAFRQPVSLGGVQTKSVLRYMGPTEAEKALGISPKEYEEQYGGAVGLHPTWGTATQFGDWDIDPWAFLQATAVEKGPEGDVQFRQLAGTSFAESDVLRLARMDIGGGMADEEKKLRAVQNVQQAQAWARERHTRVTPDELTEFSIQREVESKAQGRVYNFAERQLRWGLKAAAERAQGKDAMTLNVAAEEVGKFYLGAQSRGLSQAEQQAQSGQGFERLLDIYASASAASGGGMSGGAGINYKGQGGMIGATFEAVSEMGEMSASSKAAMLMRPDLPGFERLTEIMEQTTGMGGGTKRGGLLGEAIGIVLPERPQNLAQWAERGVLGQVLGGAVMERGVREAMENPEGMITRSGTFRQFTPSEQDKALAREGEAGKGMLQVRYHGTLGKDPLETKVEKIQKILQTERLPGAERRKLEGMLEALGVGAEATVPPSAAEAVAPTAPSALTPPVISGIAAEKGFLGFGLPEEGGTVQAYVGQEVREFQVTDTASLLQHLEEQGMSWYQGPREDAPAELARLRAERGKGPTPTAARPPGPAKVTVPQLRQQARDMGLTGYSRLRKAELQALIAGKDKPAPAPRPVPTAPLSTQAPGPSEWAGAGLFEEATARITGVLGVAPTAEEAPQMMDDLARYSQGGRVPVEGGAPGETQQTPLRQQLNEMIQAHPGMAQQVQQVWQAALPQGMGMGEFDGTLGHQYKQWLQMRAGGGAGAGGGGGGGVAGGGAGVPGFPGGPPDQPGKGYVQYATDIHGKRTIRGEWEEDGGDLSDQQRAIMGAMVKFGDALDARAEQLGKAVDAGRDLTKAELKTATVLETYHTQMKRAVKQAEAAGLATEQTVARGAVQQLEAMGMPELGAKAQVQQQLMQMGAIQEPPGMRRRKALGGGFRAVFSGWEMMRMKRMWGMTGAPVFQEMIPAAAQADVAGWQATVAMGGFEPGMAPGGVAGGVMRQQAAGRQANIEAGRVGYRAWGWAQGVGTGLTRARAQFMPAVGAGALAGTVAGIAAPMFFGGALGAAGITGAAAVAGTIALPVAVAVAGIVAAVGVGAAAYSAGDSTAENALRLAQAEEEGGIGGWWERGLQRTGMVMRQGELPHEGALDRMTSRVLGIPAAGAGRITTVEDQMTAQLTRGQEMWDQPLAGMPAEDRMAALGVATERLQELGAPVFQQMDQGQIAALVGEFAAYRPEMTPEEIEAGPEWLEQAAVTGMTPKAFAPLAKMMGMGWREAETLLGEVGAMSAEEQMDWISKAEALAPLARFGVEGEEMKAAIGAGWEAPTGEAGATWKRMLGGSRTAWTEYGQDQGISAYQTQDPTTGMPIGSQWGSAILAGRIQAGQTGIRQGPGAGGPPELEGMDITINAGRAFVNIGGDQVEMTQWGLQQKGQEMRQEERRWGAEQARGRFELGQAYVMGTGQFEGRGQWGFQDQQREMQWGRQMEQFGFAQEGLDLNYSQFQERRGLQGQRFEWQTSFQREGMGIQWQRQQTKFGWAEEDLAFRGAQTTMQYGWQMEDIQEQMRYSTGRERRGLMKKQERATVMFGMGMGRLEGEEDRLDQRREWAEEDHNRGRRFFEQRVQWSRQEMAMSGRHFAERHTLSQRRLDADKAYFVETFDFQGGRIETEREYWEAQQAFAESQLTHNEAQIVQWEAYEVAVTNVNNAIALQNAQWMAMFEAGGPVQRAYLEVGGLFDYMAQRAAGMTGGGYAGVVQNDPYRGGGPQEY